MHVGLVNTDFERKVALRNYPNGDEIKYYYCPREDMGSYKSIVNPNGILSSDNTMMVNYFKTNENLDIDKYLKYIKSKAPSGEMLGSIYYTALGRERYGIYKANQDTTQMEEDVGLRKKIN